MRSFLACGAALALSACAGAHPASISGPRRGEGPGAGHGATTYPEHWDSGVSPGQAEPRGRVARRTIADHRYDGPAPLTYVEDTGTPEPTLAPMMQKDECLDDLGRTGTHFRRLPDLKGVEVPIEVTSSLGGVTYFTEGGTKLQMDCRLALALTRVAPVLRRHGVTRVRYSGAYVYKTTSSGRLSHHAHGLAIDLHAFEMKGHVADVERDFERGVGCRKDGPELNGLACELRASRVFDEFLTPDYNYDHRDHLHVSVPRRRA